MRIQLFLITIAFISCRHKAVLYDEAELDKITRQQYVSLKDKRIHFDFTIDKSGKADPSKLPDIVSGIAITDTSSSLPHDLLKFKNIKTLFILHSKFDTIPEWIGDFTYLEKLTVHDSEVRSIPHSIGNLKHLKRLILFRSSITHIPKEIGNLTTLKELDISANKLKEFHDEWGNLKSLEELQMAGVGIQELPKFIFSLEKLKYLRISENELTHIPVEISNLKELKEINCVYNSFDTLERIRIKALLPNCKIEFDYPNHE